MENILDDSLSPLSLKDSADVGKNFILMDDSKKSLSPESDFDSELEKCAKILDLESDMEFDKVGVNQEEVSTEGPEKLEFKDALCDKLDTRSSFLNMTEQQFLYFKNSVNSLNEDFQLVDEKFDTTENNISSPENIDLLDSESSSSSLESVILISDESYIELETDSDDILECNIEKNLLAKSHEVDAMQTAFIINTQSEQTDIDSESDLQDDFILGLETEEVDSILGDAIEDTNTTKQENIMQVPYEYQNIQDLKLSFTDACFKLKNDKINDIQYCNEEEKSTIIKKKANELEIMDHYNVVNNDAKTFNKDNFHRIKYDIEQNDLLKFESLPEDEDKPTALGVENMCRINERVNTFNLISVKLEKYEESVEENLLECGDKQKTCNTKYDNTFNLVRVKQESLEDSVEENLIECGDKRKTCDNNTFNLACVKQEKFEDSVEENLMECSDEQKRCDIRNTSHVNTFNLIQVKLEKCGESDTKKSIANSAQLDENKNVINQTKIEIQSTQSERKVSPEKREPSRIFKLAMKSINNKSALNNDVTAPNKKAASESSRSPIFNDEFKQNELKKNKNRKEVCKQENTSSGQNETGTYNQKILAKDKLKNDKVTKDYFEEEKEDLINPEWEAIRNLTTDEERYQQVRKSWGSRKIPDPNKNLSYHSYRKRLFRSGNPESRVITQHKRQASTNLNGNIAKRPCTFFLDKEIDEIERLKQKEKQAIINEMHNRINSIDEQCNQKEIELQRRNNGTYRNEYSMLRQQCDARVSIIADEYNQMADECDDSFSGKLGTLNERRDEVLKFYRFYQGLNVVNKDPTQLTEAQFEELNEIDNFYGQMSHYYGNIV